MSKPKAIPGLERERETQRAALIDLSVLYSSLETERDRLKAENAKLQDRLFRHRAALEDLYRMSFGSHLSLIKGVLKDKGIDPCELDE